MLNLFLTLLTSTRIYQWFVRTVLPNLSFRVWGSPTYPMENYFSIREVIRNNPNQIYFFVGLNRWMLSYRLNKLLTKAKWNHAGYLYLDGNGEIRIRHMIAKGEEDWSLLDYLREIDDFQLLLLPVPEENKVKIQNRINRLWENENNITYDFSFELRGDFIKLLDDPSADIPSPQLYCSEYVWVVAYGLVDNDAFKPRVNLDRKLFEPDDVYKACEKVDIGH